MENLKKESISQVLAAIEKEINKHNEEKETIETEMNQTYNEQIKAEGAQDIAKLEEVISSYEDERQSFLALVQEQSTNTNMLEEVNKTLDKMKLDKEHLVKEQEQCRAEIEKVKAKDFFSSLNNPVELQEYEMDLENITGELNSLDAKMEEYHEQLAHIADRNNQIAQSIDETLERYHVSIDEVQRKNEEDLAWEEYKKAREDENIQETPEEKEAIEKWLNGELDPEEKTRASQNTKRQLGGEVTEPPKSNRRPIPPTPSNPNQRQTPPKPPASPKPDKKEVGQINFDEASCFIEVFDKDGKFILAKGFEQYILEKHADNEFLDRLKKSNDEIIAQIGEENADLLDPRILMILEDIGTKKDIMQYAKSIADKEEKMPFSVKYNLKDIYKGEKYTLEEIKQINKWSKTAKKQNKDKVHIEKDNWVKRLIGNIKTRKEERKLLPAPLKEIHPISGTKEILSKGKEVIGKGKDAVVQGAKDIRHFTSKKISNAMRHGKNLRDIAHISGIKISGYFKGENPLLTMMKADNIRNRSFVPKATVDEKAAIEKVQASQEDKNREVIIENPDGTKEVGTRLWSIDDENIK